MRFYDRQEELRILRGNEEASKSHASFMVMMGRRRVGKTSLLTKAFAGTDYAYLFVSRDSEAMLCGKFQRALEEQLGIHVYGTTTHLRELFEVMMKESTLRHFTLIIDEFQDLYKVNSASFSDLQDVWDRYHTQSKIAKSPVPATYLQCGCPYDKNRNMVCLGTQITQNTQIG